MGGAGDREPRPGHARRPAALRRVAAPAPYRHGAGSRLACAGRPDRLPAASVRDHGGIDVAEEAARPQQDGRPRRSIAGGGGMTMAELRVSRLDHWQTADEEDRRPIW